MTKNREPDKVHCGKDHQRAFDDLKAVLGKKTMVADPTRAFVVQADGSNYGLGAILSQEGDDGKEHPVTCASCKLLPKEVKFAIIKTECLGIVWVFHVYIYGQSFPVEVNIVMAAEDERLKCETYLMVSPNPKI